MSPDGTGAIALASGPAGRVAPRSQKRPRTDSGVRTRRIGARTIALGYLALLLLAPVAMIFYRTFEHGLSPVWDAVTAPNAVHAFWLSIEICAIAVPLNTIFGIGMALLLERRRFQGKALLGMLIDLPFAISPVVIGLALVLAYGKTGWFGDWLTGHGIQVIFSVPGMVIAHGDRLAAVRRARDDARAARARHRLRAGRRNARRERPCRPSGGSRCRGSAGAWSTASC